MQWSRPFVINVQLSCDDMGNLQQLLPSQVDIYPKPNQQHGRLGINNTVVLASSAPTLHGLEGDFWWDTIGLLGGLSGGAAVRVVVARRRRVHAFMRQLLR